jgi:hypothetical protein
MGHHIEQAFEPIWYLYRPTIGHLLTLAFIELRNFMDIAKEFCQGILNSPIFPENGGQLGSVQNTRERQERGMFII